MVKVAPPRRPGSASNPDKFFNELNRKMILQAVRMGAPYETAAAFGNVKDSTVRRWLLKGEQWVELPENELDTEQMEFVDFYKEYTKAEADAKLLAIGTIRRAIMQGDAKTALTFLARRDPKNWGPKAEITVSNQDSEILELLGELADEELDATDDIIDIESEELPPKELGMGDGESSS